MSNFNSSTIAYQDPVWTENNAAIDVQIDHPVHGWIPFTADPNDGEQHGRDLYARIIADGVSIAPYVAPDLSSGE